jgi:hypothetical protein
MPAFTHEAGSVRRSSVEEAHPAISTAVATVIAIRRRCERLEVILVTGRF